jgi:flagellar protein FliS
MNQTIAIETIEELLDASPSRLIVMLYDEVLARLEAAVAAVEHGDIEARCVSVNKAIEIICHLCVTLDSEQGGEIAEKLGNLYRFLLARLPAVNVLNDAEPARAAIRLLTPVRNSWTELDERIQESVAAAEALAGEVLPAMLADRALAAKAGA